MHDAVAQAPAGHRVCFREAVEYNRPVFELGNGRYGEGLAFKDKPVVYLIREDEDVGAVAEYFRNGQQVFFCPNAAGGVGRSIDEHQLGFGGNQFLERVDIQPEIFLGGQLKRNRHAAREVDAGFINREGGVGVYDFIAGVDEHQHCEEHNRLAAGYDDDLFLRGFYTFMPHSVIGYGFARLRKSGCGAVTCMAFVHSFACRVDDVLRCFKVRLAYLHMDDRPSLRFQRLCLGKDLERGFCVEKVHSLCYGVFKHLFMPPK